MDGQPLECAMDAMAELLLAGSATRGAEGPGRYTLEANREGDCRPSLPDSSLLEPPRRASRELAAVRTARAARTDTPTPPRDAGMPR